MEFKRDDFQCSFTIPDRPTVRQQLEYYSKAAGGLGHDMLLRYWIGAQALIQDWKCEKWPKLDEINIDKLASPELTDLIIWVGSSVFRFVNNLEELPKNT